LFLETGGVSLFGAGYSGFSTIGGAVELHGTWKIDVVYMLSFADTDIKQMTDRLSLIITFLINP
jgi:hypothetical protein